MKYNILELYKTMPELHKNNLEKYIIVQGIYDIYPEISDEEAELIFNFCDKNMTENINPQTFSHQLTDLYFKGEIDKKDLENSQNIDIEEVSFFDKINYFSPITEEKINEELDKDF